MFFWPAGKKNPNEDVISPESILITTLVFRFFFVVMRFHGFCYFLKECIRYYQHFKLPPPHTCGQPQVQGRILMPDPQTNYWLIITTRCCDFRGCFLPVFSGCTNYLLRKTRLLQTNCPAHNDFKCTRARHVRFLYVPICHRKARNNYQTIIYCLFCLLNMPAGNTKKMYQVACAC